MGGAELRAFLLYGNHANISLSIYFLFYLLLLLIDLY